MRRSTIRSQNHTNRTDEISPFLTIFVESVFKCLNKAFSFAIGRWMKYWRSQMLDLMLNTKSLKFLRSKLGAIVGDDCVRKSFNSKNLLERTNCFFGSCLTDILHYYVRVFRMRINTNKPHFTEERSCVV